jgi:hypothetical protein
MRPGGGEAARYEDKSALGRAFTRGIGPEYHNLESAAFRIYPRLTPSTENFLNVLW